MWCLQAPFHYAVVALLATLIVAKGEHALDASKLKPLPNTAVLSLFCHNSVCWMEDEPHNVPYWGYLLHLLTCV